VLNAVVSSSVATTAPPMAELVAASYTERFISEPAMSLHIRTVGVSSMLENTGSTGEVLAGQQR